MRIGELASRTGVSVRSLRYYEEQGLLHSARSASGQRHYAEGAVERVVLIQQLFAAGLASRTIVELLPCVDAPSEEANAASLERMEEERARLAQHIAELAGTLEALDGVIASARQYRERLWPTAASPSR